MTAPDTADFAAGQTAIALSNVLLSVTAQAVPYTTPNIDVSAYSAVIIQASINGPGGTDPLIQVFLTWGTDNVLEGGDCYSMVNNMTGAGAQVTDAIFPVRGDLLRVSFSGVTGEPGLMNVQIVGITRAVDTPWYNRGGDQDPLMPAYGTNIVVPANTSQVVALTGPFPNGVNIAFLGATTSKVQVYVPVLSGGVWTPQSMYILAGIAANLFVNITAPLVNRVLQIQLANSSAAPATMSYRVLGY